MKLQHNGRTTPFIPIQVDVSGPTEVNIIHTSYYRCYWLSNNAVLEFLNGVRSDFEPIIRLTAVTKTTLPFLLQCGVTVFAGLSPKHSQIMLRHS